MASATTTSSAGPLPGLRDCAEALARGDISSAALVEQSLARIEATQPTLNAFRCLRTDAARTEAAEADRRRAAGERAPLLGVPVAIKDDTDIAGETTPFGCAGDFEPKREDAEVVRRLRAAGAVVVGKTTAPELGQWPICEGAAFGVTRNPWRLGHTPGGSSGGSAAAVAAGLVPAALGSDGAGSVRIPAAWCHLVGIKPQRGRISTWPDAEAFNGLTCFGPLARSVEDAALLLDATSGNCAGDLHQPPPPPEPYATLAQREPRRLRIALSLRPPFVAVRAPLRPAVRSAVERLAGVLAALGHEVIRADPLYGLVGLSIVPRGADGLHSWLERVPDPGLLDPRTRSAANSGRWLGGPLLRAARAAERPLQAQVGRIFRHADVVLAPTTARPALRVGALDGLSSLQTDRLVAAACPYAFPWNVLGWPAVNVPAGITHDGLPVGAQLLGHANDEATLISLAGQLERSERWHERWPPPLA